jgi:hypothetical protein
MAYQHCNPDAGTITGTFDDLSDLDAFLINDEADEFLDRQLAEIRDSLPEFRGW